MFNHAAAIGVDIGRNSIKIAVVKINGEVIAAKSYPLNQEQTRDYIISMIFMAIRDIRNSVAPEGINPICVGVAAKGFIDHMSGIVIGPDQGIKGWTNVPLAKLVNQETGLPAYVGNDANMMTIAEHRFGAAKGFNNIIFVALRTGIGGGIIINGKLYRGVNNAGGEVGQMIINFNDEISDKGIRGSYEHFASASAIVRRYQYRLYASWTHQLHAYGLGSRFDRRADGSPRLDIPEISRRTSPRTYRIFRRKKSAGCT